MKSFKKALGWWLAMVVTSLMVVHNYIEFYIPDGIKEKAYYVHVIGADEIIHLQRDVIRIETDLLRQFIVLETLNQWRKSVLKPDRIEFQPMSEYDKALIRDAIKERYDGLTNDDQGAKIQSGANKPFGPH